MTVMTPTPRGVQGFTLIEALVALLTLSIGLLGVAGLQLLGLKANFSAGSRTQATYLAYDIADRMRANRTDALAGNYNIALGAAASGTGTANLDKAAWKSALASSLFQGDGSVSVDVNGVATIVIQWNDARGNSPLQIAGGDTLTFQTSTQL